MKNNTLDISLIRALLSLFLPGYGGGDRINQLSPKERYIEELRRAVDNVFLRPETYRRAIHLLTECPYPLSELPMEDLLCGVAEQNDRLTKSSRELRSTRSAFKKLETLIKELKNNY